MNLAASKTVERWARVLHLFLVTVSIFLCAVLLAIIASFWTDASMTFAKESPIQGTPETTLLLASDNDLCVRIEAVNVEEQFVVGGQFFLEYDPAVLEFIGIVPGDQAGLSCKSAGKSPFDTCLYEMIDEEAGTIVYVVIQLPGDQIVPPGDCCMATIEFRPVDENSTCVSWQWEHDPNNPEHGQPVTRLTTMGGGNVLPLELVGLCVEDGQENLR